MQSQVKKSSLAKESNRLHQNFPSIQSERARGDCAKKKLPFNRKKPPLEPEPGRVAICLDQLGAERTGKRGQQAP